MIVEPNKQDVPGILRIYIGRYRRDSAPVKEEDKE